MKQLIRTPDDRWIAGVCGGIADYLGVDTAIVRIALVVGTLLGAGSLVIGYLAAWVLVPQRNRRETVRAQANDGPATAAGPGPRWQ
jgi:phage shock protein C